MEQLKQQLLHLANNTELPLEAIYYVVKDFYRDVEDAYRHALQEHKKTAQEAALAEENNQEENE